MKKVAFVTTFCPHHRQKTFELFASHYDETFYFFSPGDEWYWQERHGTRSGSFHYDNVSGYRVGRTRIVPALGWKLMLGDFDVFIKCINGRFALPITYIISKLKRKPFILWTGVWTRIKTPFHRLFFPVTRYIYLHADAIVVYGEHVKRYLISEGVAPERVFIARHAVDNDAYNQPVTEEKLLSLRRGLSIGPEQKILLFLGRIEKVKGLIYLIEAVALLDLDNVTLILAGTGSKSSEIQELVRKREIIERVRFAGYVEPEEANQYYALASVFVLPSISLPEGKELWGLVINEAFNQGVPVITTDAVGSAAGGLVEDGVNGFIVPEQDSAAIAFSLKKLLEDPALYQVMSDNARRTVTRWTNEEMVKGFQRAVDYVT